MSDPTIPDTLDGPHGEIHPANLDPSKIGSTAGRRQAIVSVLAAVLI
jgi:hypothetical protein